jgi:hypothetical protein
VNQKHPRRPFSKRIEEGEPTRNGGHRKEVIVVLAAEE